MQIEIKIAFIYNLHSCPFWKQGQREPRGWGGGGESHMKGVGLLVVSLGGWWWGGGTNFGF